MPLFDRWEHRFINWKTQKNTPEEKPVIGEKEKKALKEYDALRKIEVLEAKNKNIYDIKEIVNFRRRALIALIILLIFTFVILTVIRSKN